jgi:PIN domain nuclease of toxin-antitoxin system
LTALLVDTHALLWWRGDHERLSARALEAIANPDASLYFSAASIWEMSIKQSKGKLDIPGSLLETMEQRGFIEIPVSSHHAMLAAVLPPHHADPFDRMLVAQAQSEGLTLVTRDARLSAYGVPVLW